MSLPQIPPGGGQNRAHTHFAYVATSNKAPWHAYTAGPCHWFVMHTKGKSKPCLHAISGGELVCERCHSTTPPGVYGYLPLYRQVDSRPVMVIVAECDRERIDAIKFHARVLIGREAGRADGVWVAVALDQQPRFTTTMKERQRPADLTETLLRVWSIPELTEWYRRTHGGSDKPVSLPAPAQTVAVKDDGEPFGPEYQGAAKRNGATVLGPDDPGYDAALARLRERARQCEPSENGHTKKPKPK